MPYLDEEPGPHHGVPLLPLWARLGALPSAQGSRADLHITAERERRGTERTDVRGTCCRIYTHTTARSRQDTSNTRPRAHFPPHGSIGTHSAQDVGCMYTRLIYVYVSIIHVREDLVFGELLLLGLLLLQQGLLLHHHISSLGSTMRPSEYPAYRVDQEVRLSTHHSTSPYRGLMLMSQYNEFPYMIVLCTFINIYLVDVSYLQLGQQSAIGPLGLCTCRPAQLCLPHPTEAAHRQPHTMNNMLCSHVMLIPQDDRAPPCPHTFHATVPPIASCMWLWRPVSCLWLLPVDLVSLDLAGLGPRLLRTILRQLRYTPHQCRQ